MADPLIEVTVADGKYTIREHAPYKWEALRYGEHWPAMADGPDNLHIALAYEVHALRNPEKTFQQRVMDWSIECFGTEIAHDRTERNHRFLEESLELANACGCTASEAHQLVDYVFRKTDDDKLQEAGGVMVTLALLLEVHRIQMEAAGEQELARIWTKVDAIRAKQAAKPKHSPLPQED